MTKAAWLRFAAAVKKPLSFRPNWRELASTVGELGAIGAISHGAWLVTPAAGWIAAGVGLGAVSVAVSRGDSG